MSTRAALTAAKERGVKLGGPKLAEAQQKSMEVRVAQADAFAANAYFNAGSGIVTQNIGSSSWTLTNSYIIGQDAAATAAVTHVSGSLRVTNAAGLAQLLDPGRAHDVRTERRVLRWRPDPRRGAGFPFDSGYPGSI